MRRQSKSSSKSRRNDKRRAQVSAVSNVYSFSSELIVDPFQLSTCCVCGGIEDEDLIILCDGPGCNSEVHMYCLEPVMTAVPVGDWFCESCDNLGSTITLRKYFSDFEASISTLQQSPKEEYKTFLAILQQRAVPFDNWTPGFHDELVPSEFDSASEDLIGCTVRLSVSPTDYQTGRILNRRVDLNLDRWEHFVQFKR